MRIIISFCFIGFCFLSAAQTQQDTINLIDSLVLNAQEIEKSGKHAAAVAQYKKSIELSNTAKLNPGVEGYINALIGYSYLRKGDARTAMQYLQKGRVGYELGDNTTDPDYCSILFDLGMIAHYDLKQPVDSLYHYARLSLDCALKAHQPDDPILAKYYYMAGSCRLNQRDIKAAKTYFRQAHLILNQHRDRYPIQFLEVSEYLVSAFTDLQQLDSAVFIAKERLNVCKQFFAPKDSNLARVYYILAYTLNVAHFIDSSIVYLDSARQIYPRVCKPETKAEFYYRGGTHFFQQKDFTKAKYYFIQSGTYLSDNKIMTSLEGSAWLYVAGILTMDMKVVEARQYFEKACTLFRRDLGENNYRTQRVCGMADAATNFDFSKLDISILFPDIKPGDIKEAIEQLLNKGTSITIGHPELDILFQEARQVSHFPDLLMALGALSSGNYPEVIKLVQRFYTKIVPGFTDSLNLRADPDLNTPMMETNIFMTAMLLKSTAFDQLGRKSKNSEYLKYACRLLEKCDTIITNIRINAGREDLETWGRIISNVYWEMMYTASTTADMIGDDAYYDKAFYASEKLKAFALLKTADPEKARALAPPNLLAREKELDQQSMRIRRDLVNTYQQSNSGKTGTKTLSDKAQGKVRIWTDSLFQVETARSKLRLELQVQYPKYWETMNEKPIIPVHQLSNILDGRTTILSYTYLKVNEINLLVLTDGENSFHIGKTIPGLKTMIDAVADYVTGKNTDKANYAKAASKLYKELLTNIPAGTEQLVIIPDGYLHNLSFEALLTENLTNPASTPFTDFPFLLNKYAISYGYSATLTYHLLKNRQEHTYPNFLLGYSSPLYKNFTEVRPLFDAKNLKYTIREKMENATKADLLGQDLKSYKMVHIAAHGR